MNILKSDVAAFKKLYKEKFDIDLDYQDAFKKLSLLVRQMEIVYQPITKQQLDGLIRDATKNEKPRAK